eukprot:7465979-Karenia_brevis.AAC.1
MVLHNFSDLNARDGLIIMSDTSVQSTAMALRERYVFFTAPSMNPYHMPAPHVDLPQEAKDERGQPKRDRAGFERDRLPAADPSLFEFMK